MKATSQYQSHCCISPSIARWLSRFLWRDRPLHMQSILFSLDSNVLRHALVLHTHSVVHTKKNTWPTNHPRSRIYRHCLWAVGINCFFRLFKSFIVCNLIFFSPLIYINNTQIYHLIHLKVILFFPYDFLVPCTQGFKFPQVYVFSHHISISKFWLFFFHHFCGLFFWILCSMRFFPSSIKHNNYNFNTYQFLTPNQTWTYLWSPVFLSFWSSAAMMYRLPRPRHQISIWFF